MSCSSSCGSCTILSTHRKHSLQVLVMLNSTTLGRRLASLARGLFRPRAHPLFLYLPFLSPELYHGGGRGCVPLGARKHRACTQEGLRSLSPLDFTGKLAGGCSLTSAGGRRCIAVIGRMPSNRRTSKSRSRPSCTCSFVLQYTDI